MLLHWNGDTELVFSNRDTAGYFSGGWLEEYVATKLHRLTLRDYATNLEVEAVGSSTGNEIDALVVHRNCALLIECKTARFGHDDAKDQDYIYKLAQLTLKVGGQMGRSLLLSARQVKPEVRQRAREYKVDVLAAEELGQFVHYMKGWMDASAKN